MMIKQLKNAFFAFTLLFKRKKGTNTNGTITVPKLERYERTPYQNYSDRMDAINFRLLRNGDFDVINASMAVDLLVDKQIKPFDHKLQQQKQRSQQQNWKHWKKRI